MTSTSPEEGDVGRVHSRVNGFIQDYRVVLEQGGYSNTLRHTVAATADPNLA